MSRFSVPTITPQPGAKLSSSPLTVDETTHEATAAGALDAQEYVMIMAEADMYMLWSKAGTPATAGDFRIVADTIYFFEVEDGDRVSFLRATGTGAISVYVHAVKQP